MSPLWAVLTASALALAVAGWLPRSLRPAPTIAAAVLVMATAAVAISVLGMNRPFLLIFLGAAVGLGFAIGHRRASGGGGSVARRLARWGLALSATALSVGLVCCGAAGATAFPAFTPPTPPQLSPAAVWLGESSCRQEAWGRRLSAASAAWPEPGRRAIGGRAE